MVRLVQLLCPSRHCVLALPYVPGESPVPDTTVFLTEENAAGFLKEGFDELVGAGLQAWCGLCHSRELVYEDRETKFRTMDDALPELQEEAAKNNATRIAVKGGLVETATDWCAPGKGATVDELVRLIENDRRAAPLIDALSARAAGPTNLRIRGSP